MTAIRSLGEADAGTVAALIRLAFASLSATVEPPPSALRETAANIAAIFAAGGGGAGVDLDGRLVAACIWQPQEGGLYFGRLSVHPEARGRGLARALIAAAEAEALARGLPRVLLSTRLALADNRRLFAAMGFREVALQAHPGFAEPTFVDMEKSLISTG